jgi:hypothetical protein
LQCHRDGELGFPERKQKPRREHADDRVGCPIQRNVRTDQARVAAESTLPEAMRHRGDAPLARFVIGLEDAP